MRLYWLVSHDILCSTMERRWVPTSLSYLSKSDQYRDKASSTAVYKAVTTQAAHLRHLEYNE